MFYRNFTACFLLQFIYFCISLDGSVDSDVRLYMQKAKKIIGLIESSEHLRSMGTGSACPDGIALEFDFRFQSLKNTSLEESRKQMIRVINIALDEINHDREIQHLLIERPFTEKHLDIFISYLDPQGKDPTSPYVCCVKLIEGMLKYNESKPPEKRKSILDLQKMILIETYDEALEKLKQEPSID